MVGWGGIELPCASGYESFALSIQPTKPTKRTRFSLAADSSSLYSLSFLRSVSSVTLPPYHACQDIALIKRLRE